MRKSPSVKKQAGIAVSYVSYWNCRLLSEHQM